MNMWPDFLDNMPVPNIFSTMEYVQIPALLIGLDDSGKPVYKLGSTTPEDMHKKTMNFRKSKNGAVSAKGKGR